MITLKSIIDILINHDSVFSMHRALVCKSLRSTRWSAMTMRCTKKSGAHGLLSGKNRADRWSNHLCRLVRYQQMPDAQMYIGVQRTHADYPVSLQLVLHSVITGLRHTNCLRHLHESGVRKEMIVEFLKKYRSQLELAALFMINQKRVGQFL